jgi:hypothetical protein
MSASVGSSVENFWENVEKKCNVRRDFAEFGCTLCGFGEKCGKFFVSNKISHAERGNIRSFRGVFKTLFHSLCKTWVDLL